MTALAWCCGTGLIAAVVLVVSGLRQAGERRHRASSGLAPRPADLSSRVVLAVAGAVSVGALTGWPVAALAGAVMGFFTKALLSPRAVRQEPIERTEAVAVWTEQLRDTMAAAAGLQQAIVATAPLSPELIRPEIIRAAESAVHQPLVPALRRLANELDNPTADLAVTALVLTASGEGQDLGEVLSTIASAARDDATMRRQVDASRARTRTAVRAITAIALVTMIALLVVGHGYLKPYSYAAGQVVLAVVLAFYGLGVAMLHRMGTQKPPERVLSPAVEGTAR